MCFIFVGHTETDPDPHMLPSSPAEHGLELKELYICPTINVHHPSVRPNHVYPYLFRGVASVHFLT